MQIKDERTNQLVDIQVDEKEFLRIVNKISKRLANAYKFGIYTKEDIEQEIAELCIKALPRWDGVRPLDSFLFTHTKNRLTNLKRDEWYRATCPCELCSHKLDGETGHFDKKHCAQFLAWKELNASKANIAFPNAIPANYDNIVPFEVMDKMCNKEVFDFIDEHLPITLRKNYLKIKSGIRITDNEHKEVITFLKGLFNVN